ncbi:MAG: CRTAC1 family protein [Gemmataceae bacterium]|nr:CRTAC1 family protein [Gemmataceae bacterium]
MSLRLCLRLLAWFGCCALAAGLGACGRTDPPPQPPPPDRAGNSGPGYFEDKTPGSGLTFTYRNGEEADHYTILESLGGGVALIDYDQDGLLDIFVTGGGYFDGPKKQDIRGHPCRLFKNLGGWKFKDVTAEAGLQRAVERAGPVGRLDRSSDALAYTHGCAVGDYDNDGWPDLLVTGYGRLTLYRNNRGVFEDVTGKAGLTDPGPLHWSTSAGWADLNGDGWPDLFVVHYVDWSFGNHPQCKGYKVGQKVDVCPPEQFQPLPHALYLNGGNGTFTLAKDAGILPGKGLGVVIVDVNDDGKPDLYVANDSTANYLYLNRGGGKFEEAGLASGVAYDNNARANGSMGVDAADYDGSGRFSLFVSNYEKESHCLYRNLGKGLFQEVSGPTRIAAIGLSFVGFGTGFFDLDRDGAEDLFITNGHVIRHPAADNRVQRPVLFHNLSKPGEPPPNPPLPGGGQGGVRFADVSSAGGPYFRGRYLGRGAALGDLDNDGRVDLVISHMNSPVALLRNVVENNNHWLGVALKGKSDRDAVGARLTLEAGGQKLVRAVKGGGSYLSANDRRVVFGLGAVDRVQRLTVRWPSGQEQSWAADVLGLDRYVTLEEEPPRD